MRPEIVFTVLLILALSAVLNYALCVMAAEAEEKAEMARKNLEKEKQKREPRIVMLEGECAVRTLQPDSAERGEEKDG